MFLTCSYRVKNGDMFEVDSAVTKTFSAFLRKEFFSATHVHEDN